MGYYSELNADEQCWKQHDHSIISPVLQWEWRIEDLISRLEDITGERYGSIAFNYQGCRFTDADLTYSSPEFFSRASDIMAAIDIAKEKIEEIKEEDDLVRPKKKIITDNVCDDILGQITIWDYLVSTSGDAAEEFSLDFAA